MSQNIPAKVTAALASFDAARADLLNFREDNKIVLMEYDQHLTAYNETLNAAKAAVRDSADVLEGGIGDFSITRPVSVDVDMLITLLGEEDAKPFLVHKYALNKEAYESAVADGRISQALVADLEKEGTPAIRGPKEYGVFSGIKKKGGR